MTVVVGLAGFALEAIGLIISALGFWTTWREFEPAGGQFLGWLLSPIGRWIAAGAARGESAIRRLLRRPKPIAGYARIGGRLNLVGGIASVRIGYGDLPGDQVAALAELHRRTKQLMERLSSVDEQLAKEADDRESAVQALQSDLEARLGRVEDQGQRIAIGGIRAQTLGLTLIALGIVLQTWAFMDSMRALR